MLTQKQQAIIMVSFIGTILSEYKDDEVTTAIKDLKFNCKRFMDSESGVKLIPFVGARITDKKKYDNYIKTVKIGDKLWQEALDRYAIKSVSFDAYAMINSIYSFSPEIMAKFAHISKSKMKAYAKESEDGEESLIRAGIVLGGFLNEIMARESGKKINGRLSAIKKHVESQVLKDKDAVKNKSLAFIESIKSGTEA